MKARTNQHQVIAGGGAAPSLADVLILTTPDKVSLPDTLDMERGPHMRLRLVLINLFVPDYPTVLDMREVNTEIMKTETEL